MSLKDYGENEIQEDLNRLLIRVQKELKKKMFPRKHRPLLRNDVEIFLDDLDIKVAGTYETIKDKENEHRFKHKIIISELEYDEYKNGLYCIGKYKRNTKKRLKDTIAHELIHAYVYENYEWFSNDSYEFHNDGSPIFLSILVFLNIHSGHKTMEGFRHTDLYKKVKSYDSFEMLEVYLIHLYSQYEKIFRELDTVIDEGKIHVNSFKFSYGYITGVKGIDTNTIMYDKCIAKGNIFRLGANTDINKLKNLVLSKINRNVFDNKYVMLDCRDIKDKRNKLKFQSMDI